MFATQQVHAYLSIHFRISKYEVIIDTTWMYHTFCLLRSSLLNAHFCLHCSHVTGDPHLSSDTTQRLHLLPINAAMMLHISHALGYNNDPKSDNHEHTENCDWWSSTTIHNNVASLYNIISTVLLFGKQICYTCRSIFFPRVTDYHSSFRPVLKKVIGSFPESFPALS